MVRRLDQGAIKTLPEDVPTDFVPAGWQKALRDDRGYFPPYEAAAVVRVEALAAFPGLRAALQELAGAIPTATMQRLNYQVDGKHRAVAEVAAEFLKTR